jgi:hypothetical protein
MELLVGLLMDDWPTQPSPREVLPDDIFNPEEKE